MPGHMRFAMIRPSGRECRLVAHTAAIEEEALYQELQRVIRVKGINRIDMRGGNHAGEARIGRDTRQGEQNGSLSCPSLYTTAGTDSREDTLDYLSWTCGELPFLYRCFFVLRKQARTSLRVSPRSRPLHTLLSIVPSRPRFNNSRVPM